MGSFEHLPVLGKGILIRDTSCGFFHFSPVLLEGVLLTQIEGPCTEGVVRDHNAHRGIFNLGYMKKMDFSDEDLRPHCSTKLDLQHFQGVKC